MMRFLVVDVFDDCGNIGRTHAERAISLLPGEPSSLLAHPPGRIRLEQTDGAGERYSGRQSKQSMNVIVHASNREYQNGITLEDASHVGPESPLQGFSDELLAALRAEY